MEKTFQDKTNLYGKIEEALSKKDVIVLTKSEKSKLERLEKKHKVSFDSLYKEFEKGVKVEKEHMKNIKETKKIALDHLAEDPKYYTKLKKAKLEEGILKTLKENLNYPIELKRKKKISNIGFCGYREHTIGKVNLSDLKVLDNGIEIAKNTLKNDKSFKPSNKPITVGIDIITGEKQLLDGYHRYVSNHGQGIMNAFFIPMKNGDIISFDEINDSSIEEEALPKKLKSDIKVEYHKSLNPKIWLNNHLKSGIRKNLLNLAKFYFKQLDLGIELQDIIFTGSLANYNYTNLSDIDLHLVIDYKELTDDDEFAKEYFGDKRAIWADSNDIKINGFPVEIYVQDISQLDDKGMGAMYSLLNNKWIKKPKYNLPEVDKHLITQKVNKYLDIFNKISMMNDTIKKVDSYNKVFEKIRDARRKSTKEEGEFSVDNLVFKVLRNKKVFDIIRNNKKEIVNNVFSINSN